MKVIVKGQITYAFEAELDLSNPRVESHEDKEVLRSYLTGQYDLDLLKNDPAERRVLKLELIRQWINDQIEHEELLTVSVDTIEPSHDPEVE